MIADIPMERTTMFDPDKRIEKKVTLNELESWTDKESDIFSSLEDLMLEIYYFEKDNENSERIFNAIKKVYKIRKNILSTCQKYNRSNNREITQIIDNLLGL